MVTRNNVTRALEKQGVSYQVLELPPEKLGAHEVAALLGIPPALIFKTIVVVRKLPGKPVLAVLPGDALVDLKKVAKLIGEKGVRLPTERDAETITGLRAGAISPLAITHKGFRVLLDDYALSIDWMHVSGGQRGLTIRLKVQDFVRLTKATVATLRVFDDSTAFRR